VVLALQLDALVVANGHVIRRRIGVARRVRLDRRALVG
jgi:hypothetical protein